MNIEKNIEYSVAIYIRLSKEDGDKEESESVTNQRKILRAFAEENHYRIYDEYVDDGYTGTNFNRPDFKRMITDIENKKVNMVITKSLSRLGRDYIETGRYIEKYFPENNIRYIAVLDDVDTFLDKNCDTVALKNIFNDFFAKETSKNVKRTKNKKKKEGFYYITYAPFGYKKVSKSGKIEIDEVQSKIVKMIFDLFIVGKGTYQIAKELNNLKIDPPGLQMKMANVLKNTTDTTNKWSHNTVRRILENESYIGNCVQNKTKKISYKSKKIISLSEEEYTITEKHHEAIINLDKFNLVQKILANHKNDKVRDTDVLLKGILYCSHCNNKLIIRTKTDKTKSGEKIRRYIYCQTANKEFSNKKCYKKYINYDNFEKETLDKITEILNMYINSNAFKNEEALKKLLESQESRYTIDNKIKKLNNDLENINKKINMAYSDRLNGILEEQDFKLFSVGLINERKRIESLLYELKSQIKDFSENMMSETIKSDMKKVIENLLKNKLYTKEVLNQLVNRIEVDKNNNVIIYFNFHELNCLGGVIENVKQAVNL